MTEVAAAAPAKIAPALPTRRELPAWRLLTRRPSFLIGAMILLFWIVCAVFGNAIAPHDPLAQQLLSINQPPSAAHWFGTDPLGRDVLSRVIVGARTILIITPLATLLGTVLGTALGLAMGYFGGLLDTLVSRLVEAVLALPNVIPTVVVEFTVRLGYAIFAVATLAFLGFGVQVSTPNWGSDINANYGLLGAGYWWDTLFPALAIASLVIAINLVADSVQQVASG